MKNIEFYKILICFGLLWLTYSCEKSADQNTTRNVASNGQLDNRTVAACANCPIGDCCCSVQIYPTTQSVNLRFCGTSDGASGCTDSGPGNCSSISGGGQAISLDPSNILKLFCMNPNAAFMVQNITGLGVSATIILTCQHDLTHPQADTITITDTGKVYFATNSGCAIAQCQ